ncbi:MAG: hypothetical protein V1885_00400 [Candidatus Brennerbacteria bacterium]
MDRKAVMVGWTILGVVVLFIILGAVGVFPANWMPRVNGGYQAVFLSNGQVYFGKLYHARSQYAVLRDIYYLQVTQSPQPIQEGQTPPANVNVVKLGGELHGPEDEMRINRDQILFVEDLRDDSRVVTAIEQLKTTGE